MDRGGHLLVGAVEDPARQVPATGRLTDEEELDINEVVAACYHELAAEARERVRCRLNAVRRTVRGNPELLRQALLDAGHEVLGRNAATRLTLATDDVTLTERDEIYMGTEPLTGSCVRLTLASGASEPERAQLDDAPTAGVGLGSVGAALTCCQAGVACQVVPGVGCLLRLYLPRADAA